MPLWLKKRLVSSANIIGSIKWDAFGRSLTYTRKRSGPSIDPWGMPQGYNSFKFVLLFLRTSVYCYLLDK